MVLEMPFFTLSTADIRFAERKLVWKIYMAVETIPMIRRVEIIEKTEFAAAAQNADDTIFMVYLVALVEPITMPIHSSH